MKGRNRNVPRARGPPWVFQGGLHANKQTDELTGNCSGRNPLVRDWKSSASHQKTYAQTVANWVWPQEVRPIVRSRGKDIVVDKDEADGRD